MKKIYAVNATSLNHPGKISLPGVGNRQARRWMKKMYKPGMPVLELAQTAYRSGVVDSINQAVDLASDIVYSSR